MILAAAFFIAEGFIVSHGALSVAGAVTFVIGALMLFDPAGEAYQVSIQVALAIALTLAALFGFALTKAATARNAPAAVGTHRLVGEAAQVRGDGLVFVDGELWRARTADGSPLRPGEHVRIESVQQEELQLVVAKPGSRFGKDLDVDHPDRARRRRLHPPAVPLRGDQGRARVRARRHLSARPAPAGAEGTGALPPDPGDRPDGQGRPAHDHAERAAAGGDHEGQRPGQA